MEEQREKEQSPYLGRPSSGVPDLKGKQEHSQQRTRDHGKLCHSDMQASLSEQMSVLTIRGVGVREVSGVEIKRRTNEQGQQDEHQGNLSRLQCIISNLLHSSQKLKFTLSFHLYKTIPADFFKSYS